jgi:hypothetical protein
MATDQARRPQLPIAARDPTGAGALSGKFGLFVALESALAETRPDSEPVRGLPRSRAGIADLLNESADGFFRLLAGLRVARVAALVKDGGKLPTVVIPIDQGEELFNEDGRQEAGRFMDLIGAVSARDLGVIIIVAMRSDSFPHLQNEPRLASVRKAPLDLPALPVGSMRVVIEGPARIAKPPDQTRSRPRRRFARRFSASQSRMASALSLLRLEWLMKRQAICRVTNDRPTTAKRRARGQQTIKS